MESSRETTKDGAPESLKAVASKAKTKHPHLEKTCPQFCKCRKICQKKKDAITFEKQKAKPKQQNSITPKIIQKIKKSIKLKKLHVKFKNAIRFKEMQ